MISDGNKFHGLYHQALMKEEARQKTKRRKLQQQQEEAKRVPWDYEEQNRANAELLLGLSTIKISYDVGMSTTGGDVWNRNLGSDPAERVPFDLDGRSQMWSVFNIRRYSDELCNDGYASQRGSLQLDSSYYVEVESCRASQDGAERSSKDQGAVESQEDPGTMRFVIHHEGEVHEWEVSSQDTVQQLQLFVQNKWGIGPAQQRFQIDGLPICPTLRLGLLGEGVEFKVLRAKQGGGFKKPGKGRKRGGKEGQLEPRATGQTSGRPCCTAT